MLNNLMSAEDSTQNLNTLSQEDAAHEAKMQQMLRYYFWGQSIVDRLDAKEAAYKRKLEGEAQQAAAQEAVLMRMIRNSPTGALAPITQAPTTRALTTQAPTTQAPTTQAQRMRTTYDGPMPNRPVVGGIAQVSREELADFRRKFGSQMTLRDLLNADKGLRPRNSAAVPAAAVAQAEPAGVDLEAVLAQAQQAAEAEQRQRLFAQMMRPGRDAITPIAPELALLRVPSLIAALRGGRAVAPAANMIRREPSLYPVQAQEAQLLNRGISIY